MDVVVDSSDCAMHIHNYSIVAIKSFIAEVKKYPIIYNGSNRKEGLPISSELIDFAWARIVAALLNNSVHFDLAQRRYWEKSFRALWKWMKSVLKQDMIARKTKAVHIRGPDKTWLSDLKFLEPHMQGNLGGDDDVDSHSDPGVGIEVHNSEGVVDMDNAKHTVIWLLNSLESSENENAHISICLRVPLDMCMDFEKKATSGSGVVPHGSGDNLAQSTLIPSSSNQLGWLQINTTMTRGTLPPTIVDEDYQFLMSLHEPLQKLSPVKKTRAKVLMIGELNNVLSSIKPFNKYVHE